MILFLLVTCLISISIRNKSTIGDKVPVFGSIFRNFFKVAQSVICSFLGNSPASEL